MKNKRKAGRSPKPAGEKQSKCVSVWFTVDEKKVVEVAAKSARMSASAWGARVMLAAANGGSHDAVG